MTKKRPPLLPDRHPQQELFICDILDAAPKGDMGSMEHPVFSLATRPDMKPRHYSRNGVQIDIYPSPSGLATVGDRDVLIYCISQAVAAMNSGKPVSPRMRFYAQDLLIATNRSLGGTGYQLLKNALDRLQGTQIQTNIRNGAESIYRVFSLIDSAEIIRAGEDGRMIELEVTLSKWVFDAIENDHVLTLSRDYFKLRRPLERRLYELARKHCGSQIEWSIGLDSLRLKTGSGSSLKEFKRMLSSIIADDKKHDHMPDYAFSLTDDDIVVVRQKADIKRSAAWLADIVLSEEAKGAAALYVKGEDIDAVEAVWREWVLTSERAAPADPDLAFIGFAKQYNSRR